MGLLTFFSQAFAKVTSLPAEKEYEIPDLTDAYKSVANTFAKITGVEYPIKHGQE
jgi:hypothetical protein